jgi:hypothetical protein
MFQCTHVLFSNKQYWHELVPKVFDKTEVRLHICDERRPLDYFHNGSVNTVVFIACVNKKMDLINSTIQSECWQQLHV